ncbi:MAG: phytanoyl-CoA dioxygenase family protein [Acidobacteriota bacterium]|nr:phytanoyl-CoA dioxygenase family protein [Acidobacteriota bacterium]
MPEYREEIDKFGFATTPQFIGERQIKKLIECLSELDKLPSKKNGTAYGVRNLLNLSPEIRKLAESRKVKSLVGKVLGRNAKPVRAIFFDKTAQANWKVPWHQDLTIAVKKKRETEGFTAWTRKADVPHVQPPISILEKILAVRIHLDDTDETNGALKVLSNSHKFGRLSALDIQSLRKTNRIEICSVKRGEAFLMRPLVVHSSSAGTSLSHRRVIHIEFSAESLPNALEWYGS